MNALELRTIGAQIMSEIHGEYCKCFRHGGAFVEEAHGVLPNGIKFVVQRYNGLFDVWVGETIRQSSPCAERVEVDDVLKILEEAGS